MNKPSLLVILAALTAAGCAARTAGLGGGRDRTLAEELDGRIAGEPVACVNLHDVISTRIVPGGEAIVFERRGGILYANRPQAGCAAPPDVFLRTRSSTGRLCRGESVELSHPQGSYAGSCILNDFTPYRRAR